MKLKAIKPGTVIHCKSFEEMKMLYEYLGMEKYQKTALEYWRASDSYGKADCFKIKKGNDGIEFGGFSSIGFFKTKGDEIIEFSDLIIPEVSLGEVLRITYEICNEYSNDAMDCNKDCPFCRNEFCRKWMAEHPEEVVEICYKWKSKHEKTEPEVEWIYELCLETPFSASYDVAETEEEAIKKCEEALKNEKYTKVSYKKVCRAKERSNT